MSQYYDKLLKMNESLTKELKEKGLFKEGEDEDMVPVPADSLTDDQKTGILADTVKNAGLKVDQKVLDDISKNPEQLAGVQKVLGAEQENESGAVPLEDLDWDGPAILKYDNPNTPDWGGFYVTDEEWSSDIQRATEFDSKEAAQEKLDELVDKNGMDGKYLYIWSAKMKFDEGADVSEEVVIRMDDDDLDMHGFVKGRDGKELELTDNEEEAEKFQHEELGQSTIEAICNKFHYDPTTFSTKSLDPRADEPYDEGLDLYSDDEDTFKDIEPKKRVSIPKERPLTADDEPLDLYSDEENEKWVSLDPMHPGATTLH